MKDGRVGTSRRAGPCHGGSPVSVRASSRTDCALYFAVLAGHGVGYGPGRRLHLFKRVVVQLHRPDPSDRARFRLARGGASGRPGVGGENVFGSERGHAPFSARLPPAPQGRRLPLGHRRRDAALRRGRRVSRLYRLGHRHHRAQRGRGRPARLRSPLPESVRVYRHGLLRDRVAPRRARHPRRLPLFRDQPGVCGADRPRARIHPRQNRAGTAAEPRALLDRDLRAGRADRRADAF